MFICNYPRIGLGLCFGRVCGLFRRSWTIDVLVLILFLDYSSGEFVAPLLRAFGVKSIQNVLMFYLLVHNKTCLSLFIVMFFSTIHTIDVRVCMRVEVVLVHSRIHTIDVRVCMPEETCSSTIPVFIPLAYGCEYVWRFDVLGTRTPLVGLMCCVYLCVACFGLLRQYCK